MLLDKIDGIKIRIEIKKKTSSEISIELKS